MHAHFVYYLLRHELPNIRPRAGGAATPSSASLHSATYVPIPPPRYPRKIAAILSAYDDLIENNLRGSRYWKRWRGCSTASGSSTSATPGHESVPLVDSPLGPIPEGGGEEAGRPVSTVLGGTPSRRGRNSGRVARFLGLTLER